MYFLRLSKMFSLTTVLLVDPICYNYTSKNCFQTFLRKQSILPQVCLLICVFLRLVFANILCIASVA